MHGREGGARAELRAWRRATHVVRRRRAVAGRRRALLHVVRGRRAVPWRRHVVRRREPVVLRRHATHIPGRRLHPRRLQAREGHGAGLLLRRLSRLAARAAAQQLRLQLLSRQGTLQECKGSAPMLEAKAAAGHMRQLGHCKHSRASAPQHATWYSDPLEQPRKQRTYRGHGAAQRWPRQRGNDRRLPQLPQATRLNLLA